MFINYIYKDAGSVMDIYSYSKAADKLGHKILIYGKPQKDIPLNFSLSTKDVDYLPDLSLSGKCLKCSQL